MDGDSSEAFGASIRNAVVINWNEYPDSETPARDEARDEELWDKLVMHNIKGAVMDSTNSRCLFGGFRTIRIAAILGGYTRITRIIVCSRI